ncbi:MAG: hypothetical protein IJJ15_06305 [Ruminococcus sp.]|nr:hypothetical protein [Ruminococcus sp.]
MSKQKASKKPETKTPVKQEPYRPKKSHKKELLIALIVSVVLLGIVIAATLIYQNYRHVQFEPIALIVADAVGFLITFAIVYHFVKRPEDENQL